jgi:adenylate cyclase
MKGAAFSPRTRKWLQGLAAGLLGFTLAMALWLPGWLDLWEGKTWDWRVQWLAKPAPTTDRIRLILLDQNSLDWGRLENALSWPWPREIYGLIVDYCRRQGARAVIFDVLFTEPSAYGLDDDRAFAAAIAQGPPFVGAIFLGEHSGAERRWPAFLPESGWTIGGSQSWLAQKERPGVAAPRALFPVPEIAAASRVLADTQLNPDPDNVYRRVTLFRLFANRPVPSLALGALLAARPETAAAIFPGHLSLDEGRMPLDDRGRAILRFRGGSGTHRAYSAAAVIQSELRLRQGEAPPIAGTDLFKDRYVFFGFSAPGLFDLRPAPVSGVYPGVEVHATALDNLLAGDFLRPAPAPLPPVLTLLIALLAGVLTVRVAGIAGSLLLYAFFLLLPVLAALAAYAAGVWLPLVAPEVAVAVTLLSGGVIHYTTEGRQKLFIKNAFKQYLSPAVIEELIRHPERLSLGGERRTLSIFFSDLEGFTSISEGLEPEALTTLLNEYLTAMTDIIHAEGGTVDKYEGDAIIAFWNAPLPQEDHARRCVRAALRCQEKLAALRPAFRERIGRDLKMRIGLNSGPAVVGNLGSRTRFDYTMLGDAVNLAARLEGINKQFGTYTILSEATLALLAGEIPVRELSRVSVVGRREPVRIYEPLPAGAPESRREELRLFAAGLEQFYRGQFAAAEALFAQTAEGDPAARAYLEKCAALRENPPPEWEGVWVVTTK